METTMKMDVEKEIIDIRKLYLSELISGEPDHKESIDKFITSVINYIKTDKYPKSLNESKFLLDYLKSNFEKHFLSLSDDYSVFYPSLLKMLESWKSKDEQILEWKDKYVRTYADMENLRKEFSNYQKRMVLEKQSIVSDTKWKTLSDITSLLEDFDRAIPNLTETDREGINIIYNKFLGVLTKNSVNKVVPNKGDTFNPDNMECVVSIDNPEYIGKVFDVVKNGWSIGDKIASYPQVVVGK